MKLGLVTDIHEHVDNLRAALGRFALERVEQIVVIGDVFAMGQRIEETCRLLADARAIGVWGNHDFGLCVNLDAEVRAMYPPTVLDYMTSLRPRLIIGDCHFSHVEPWLNPEELCDLWYFDGPPDEHRKLDRIFSAVPQRFLFAGHFHKWLIATPAEIDPWLGDRPIRLNQGRYFVVVGALCEGKYATFDTETLLLTPYNEG